MPRPNAVKTLAEALASLYSRAPRGIHLGLDDVREAAARAGSPQNAFACLHVAGTNGKGSVAAMLSTVLQSAGYRVGLFTSPHLCRFAERIQIDNSPVSDQALIESIDRSADFGPGLSFFESGFLAALLAFERARVDVAVLEVGLGGRLDATNIIDAPLVTGITRIALDHMDKLGTTLEAIGAEKASIGKPGAPMVLGPLSDSVNDAVRHTARACGTQQFFGLGRELNLARLGNRRVRLSFPNTQVPVELHPSLSGDHQLDNAAVAAAMAWLARTKLPKLSRESIVHGVSTTSWPGRLEMLQAGGGRVLLDCCHNPDGIRSLVAHLDELARHSDYRAERAALVFGAVADKSWTEMLPMIGTRAAHRFYVEPGGRQAAPLDELSKLQAGTPLGSVSEALRAARQSVGPEGLVIVAGSIFLAGQARAELLDIERDPAVGM